jgi:hypothetical protein
LKFSSKKIVADFIYLGHQKPSIGEASCPRRQPRRQRKIIKNAKTQMSGQGRKIGCSDICFNG